MYIFYKVSRQVFSKAHASNHLISCNIQDDDDVEDIPEEEEKAPAAEAAPAPAPAPAAEEPAKKDDDVEDIPEETAPA